MARAPILGRYVYVRSFEQVLGGIGDYCAGRNGNNNVNKLAIFVETERVQLDLPSKGTCQIMPLSERFILE